MLTNLSYDKNFDSEYVYVGEYLANIKGAGKKWNTVVGKRKTTIHYNAKRDTVRRHLANVKFPLVDDLKEIAHTIPKDILAKILKMKEENK